MRRPILAAFAAATLALAACSGSSTPSAASSAAASPSAAAGGPSGGAGASGGAVASGGAAAACAPSTSTPTVDATIANFAFHPDPLQAKVGDVIGWTNQDSAAHTATLDNGECTTDPISNGATGALVFNAPGTYAYHCRIHPQMTGTIEVSG